MYVKYIVQSERSKSEKATYRMVPIIWHSQKRQNYRDIKKSVVVRCLGEGKDELAQHPGFWGQWKKFCMIYLAKPIECITPKVNLHVIYGLWVILMCQCRFINCNKYTNLIGSVYNGRGYACRGQRVNGIFLYFVLNLC